MAAISTWSPLSLLVVILGYSIIATALLVAPLIAPLVREAWQARRAGREPEFALFQPYPSYLLRYRRVWLFCLLGPPALLCAAWFWARMF